jgi:hypothetical protein
MLLRSLKELALLLSVLTPNGSGKGDIWSDLTW